MRNPGPSPPEAPGLRRSTTDHFALEREGGRLTASFLARCAGEPNAAAIKSGEKSP